MVLSADKWYAITYETLDVVLSKSIRRLI